MADQRFLNSLPEPTADERNMGLLAHLLQVFTGFMGPLVILCIRQNSRFVKFHALQSLIWQLCFTGFFLLGFGFAFLLLFASASYDLYGLFKQHGPGSPPTIFLLFPLLWLFAVGGWLTNVTLGIVYAVKASRGEWAGYPIIGKWCFPK